MQLNEIEQPPIVKAIHLLEPTTSDVATASEQQAIDDRTTQAYWQALRAALERWETEGGTASDFAAPVSVIPRVDYGNESGSAFTQPASTSRSSNR